MHRKGAGLEARSSVKRTLLWSRRGMMVVWTRALATGTRLIDTHLSHDEGLIQSIDYAERLDTGQ